MQAAIETRDLTESRKYAKATVREQAIRLDFIIGCVERKLRMEMMRQIYCDRFKVSDATFRTDYRLAMDEMTRRLSRPREEYRAEALATYESVIRDSKVPAIVKLKAQDLLCRLLNLNEGALASNSVMPIIEIIVKDHAEALEFRAVKDRLIESTRMEAKPLVLTQSTSQPELIEW